MKVDVELVKAFTKDKTQGNPAGVVHDANHLSDNQMLKVAQILGFSESAFIQMSDKADFKVRFFAVKEEVDFCGHATIATFHSLVTHNKIVFDDKNLITVTQETKAGVFPVTCYQDGKTMMTQASPQFKNIEKDKMLIAKLLGIEESVLDKLPIQTVSTVYPMLMIPITSSLALRQIKPDYDGISRYSSAHESVGFYVFTRGDNGKQIDFAARFFNPLLGINEDPATGVAAGPLGCYANKYIFDGKKKQITIEQGFDMGKPSTIYVDISGKVLVGGYAISFGQKQLEV